MTTPDMFKQDAMVQLMTDAPTIHVTERIEYDRWIVIKGTSLDFDDLCECLSEIESEDIMLTDPAMIKVLKSLHVIEHEGSQRHMSRAQRGENFDTFYTYMKSLDK
jgi:hypothetical protein